MRIILRPLLFRVDVHLYDIVDINNILRFGFGFVVFLSVDLRGWSRVDRNYLRLLVL